MPQLPSLDLTFIEPGAHGRHGFPLTVGVPLAEGVLPEGAPVAMTNGSGEPVPVQARVMETHHDGSARWLLLDYQSDSEPLEPSTATLRPGEKPLEAPPDNRIETREEGDLLIVENGVLELELDRSRCRPLGRVRHEGERVSEGGISFRITSDEGAEFLAANDDATTFEIEESGPMRLLVRWEGTHKDDAGDGHLDFLVRLTVYAGNPFVRVDHVLINRLDDPVTKVKSIVAHLPLSLAGDRTYQFAGNDEYGRTHVEAAGPARLEVLDVLRFHLVDTETGKVLAQARMGNNIKHTNSWAGVSGADRGVLVAGKWFWQNYPKRISVEADAIDYHLIPDRGRDFEIPRGMSKTHTFFVCFHHGPADREGWAPMASRVQRWPMPAADSQYYEQCGQVWDFFPYYPKKYPQLEVSLRTFFQPDSSTTVKDPPVNRAYGLKHYGDHVHGKSVVIAQDGPIIEGPDPDAPGTYYLNNEYDTPHVLAMMFLRTREITKWWGAEAHALHMMDVDTNHYPKPHPKTDLLHDGKCMIGCQYRHCCQHIGGIQKPDETRHVPAEGSHTFAEGILDLYHLTGDRRALDIACGYAEHLSYMVLDSGYLWGLGRGSGWGMMVMAGAYSARPDERYKEAIETLMESAHNDPRIRSDRGITLAMRGVLKWHQMTGDKRARELILELTDALVDTFGPEGLPLYTDWPEGNKHTTEGQGFANLECLAYAYDLTGDRKYIDAGIGLLARVVQWINNPQYGKGLILWMRILRGPFRFMAIAHHLGLLERIPGAGGWFLPAMTTAQEAPT